MSTLSHQPGRWPALAAVSLAAPNLGGLALRLLLLPADGPSMQTVRESGDFVKLDVLHRMSLDTVLEELDWDLPEVERAELNLAWHRLDGWPDTQQRLAELRSQRTIATLSNGNISLMVDMARRSGWSWDAILGAEVARHYKPDPEVSDTLSTSHKPA